MKDNRYKTEYKRLKKVIWAGASTSVVTGMIVMGVASPAIADTIDNTPPAHTQNTRVSPMHMMRRWNSPSRAASLATSLGLNAEEVANELKSGKNIKQILQENGIEPAEVGKAFGNRKSQNKRMWKGLNKNQNQL